MRSFVFICAVLLESSALHAAEKCSAEVKMLLSSPIQTTVTSLSFENKTTGQVYFFDTDELDLLKQGVIVRVRQGANDDLTVKVRIPEDSKQAQTAQLRGRFPWEWPEGKILELSTKVAPDAGASKYADLERLADTKGLSLSTSQGAKTSTILGETLTHHTSPPR